MGYNKALSLLACLCLSALLYAQLGVNEKSTARRYGVKWKQDNPLDLGERCFDAVGLKATFGVGSTEGHSDFDSIYPWSDIRRCNVRMVGDSAVVTYDDEPGFAIDGSNGDVMVRIPKFYVEKYVEDGYEYRVVSGKGERPHPAFIEDGRELDAVYVSAFEGYMGTDSLLRSVANVIPTSNITAQQFLRAAQQRGPQYTLYDMRCVDMLFSLIAVEFGCRNTGTVFGYGIADYKQPLEPEWDYGLYYQSQTNEQQTNTITCRKQWKRFIVEGSNICICKGNQQNILTFARCISVREQGDQCVYTFDGPPIDITTDCFIGNCAQNTNWTETCSVPYMGATGRADIREDRFDARQRNPMRYRWMENLVGNVWHYLPDVAFRDAQMYVCSNMCDYQFADSATVGYTPYGTPLPTSRELGTLDDATGTNTWVTTLMDDSENRGIAFGVNYSTALTSKEAFGAYYYVHQYPAICANGGGFDHRNRCNLLTTRAWVWNDTRWHLSGARLLFKATGSQLSGATAIPIGVAKSKLCQNTPNPFTERTEIRFSVPEGTNNAYIYIFDMTGKMLRQIPVDSSMQSVTINGNELAPGIYLYSLVVNGQEIDTKKMITTKRQ
jgi:hypothetical protein